MHFLSVVSVMQSGLALLGGTAMRIGQHTKLENRLVPGEAMSPEEQLKAIFRSKYIPDPERFGPDGFWIIPGAIAVLATAWVAIRLVF